jgi:hypothetical protein
MTLARAVIFLERSPLRSIKQNMSLNEVHPQMLPGRSFALVVKADQCRSPTMRLTSAGVAPDARKSRKLVAKVDFDSLRPAASTISLW